MTSPTGVSQGVTQGPSVPNSTNTTGTLLNNLNNIRIQDTQDQTFLNALNQRLRAANTTRTGINPNQQPPTMQTLVYSPDVRVMILSDLNGEVDISRDLVRGTLIRQENAVSSFICELANTNARYNGMFNTMDRITVYMKRVSWIQVFSGYLDLVPLTQLMPGTIQLQASCTLKRVLHTWWNPSLPASVAIFEAFSGAQFAEAGDGQGGSVAGSSLGSLLATLLVDVGGWSASNVHIQQFPTSFLQSLLGNVQNDIAANNAQLLKFETMLEGTPGAGPGPYASQSNLSVAATTGNAGFGGGSAGYTNAIIQACDARSMGPHLQNLQNEYGGSQAGLTGQVTTQQTQRQAWSDQQNINNTQILQTENSDAAILGLACALAESNLMNKANQAVPDSLNYPYDGMSTTGTDIGLFNQDNSWGCLPADTQIFTANGPLRIEDIQEGEEVWSFDGHQMKLAKVTGHVMTGYKPLLTIRTAGRKLQVTANHKIPVRRYLGMADGRRPGNQYLPGTCGWETLEVDANEIRRGDYLIVPHGMSDGTATTTPAGQDVSVRLMELIGLYLGDGNCDGLGRVEISHGHGIDEDHMPYYRQAIEQELGVQARVDKRGTRTRFSSPWFRFLIDTWFGGTAATKRLPGWVFRLAPELQIALLRGYLDSDGSVDKIGRVSWSSVSKELIEGIRHLCIQVGIPVGVVSTAKPRTLTIHGRSYLSRRQSSVRLSSTEHNSQISPHSPHKRSNVSLAAKKNRLRYDKDWTGMSCGNRRGPGPPPLGTVFHRVVSIAHGTLKVPVYDIEIAGPAHYVADGIVVHNSTAQRMTPFNSAGLFYDQLNKLDWRNMDPSYAIAIVQNNQGGSSTYASFVTSATSTVQSYRAGQGEFTPLSLAGTTAGTSSLTAGQSVPGVGGSVGGGLNGPASTAPAAATAAADALQGPTPNSEGAINYIMTKLGSPYGWGSAGPSSFDCSGLFVAAFGSINVAITHDAASQTTYNPVSVTVGQSMRGCLLNPTGETGSGEGGHVVMSLGNGTIVESTTPGGVQINPISKYTYAQAGYICQNGGQNPAVPFSATPTPGGGVPPTAGNSGAPGSGTLNEPIARNLFSYMFQGLFASPTADLFTGEKAFIDDQPLMQEVIAVAAAGLRKFQSAPNGDFIAYYPDYFGTEGHPINYTIEQVEMKDVRIDFSDDALTTHVYICGDYTSMGVPDAVTAMITTAGVATVENAALFSYLTSNAVGSQNQSMTGAQIMQRYGVRPLNANYQNAGSPELEFLIACQVFMQKWAEQYKTRVQVTFMPEIFPGMRVSFAGYNLVVYVTEVYHQFDFEHGFQTELVIMAPANSNGLQNTAGVNLGGTPTNTQGFSTTQGSANSPLSGAVNGLPFSNNSLFAQEFQNSRFGGRGG